MLDPEMLAALPFALRIEIAENVARKDFTQSELAEIQRAVIEHWSVVRKANQGKRTDLTSTDFAVEVGKPARVENTTEQVARLFGESERTTRRRLDVVEAAEAEPERFAGLVADMDRSGRVGDVHRRLTIMRQAEKIRAEPPPLPTGPFRVIAADPPWKGEFAEDAARRGITSYPTMTVDEICALPVTGLAHGDCILWLWATNRDLVRGHAHRVLDAWGFEPKELLTWAKTDKAGTKDRFGVGSWLRNQTESAFLAVRGHPRVTLTNQTTWLKAPRGAHSEKPDAFYALVEALCPAPPGGYLELFARKARPGWVTWGDEAPRLKAAE